MKGGGGDRAGFSIPPQLIWKSLLSPLLLLTPAFGWLSKPKICTAKGTKSYARKHRRAKRPSAFCEQTFFLSENEWEVLGIYLDEVWRREFSDVAEANFFPLLPLRRRGAILTCGVFNRTRGIYT